MTEMQPETILGMEAGKGRWMFVIFGMFINLCLGTIYSWSVFVAPLTAYFTKGLGLEVTAGDILLPFSVFLAFFAITMLFAGKYIEQYGPRNVTIVGGILTGLGWFLASFATSVPMLCVLYGIIGGIGVGIAYGVPVAVSARWFPDRRGLAVGLTLLGFGFSAFFTANIAGYLIGAYGVMTTFRIFGVIFVILTVLLALPLKFPRAGWRPAGWAPPAPVAGQAVTCEFRREEMLKTTSFYALWGCYFIGCHCRAPACGIHQDINRVISWCISLRDDPCSDRVCHRVCIAEATTSYRQEVIIIFRNRIFFRVFNL
jgi:OFA family oxalate/formate antiporter-like MFS transporter